MTETRTEIFEVESGGERLDRTLAARLPELSRSAAQRLIGEGHVQVNDALKRASFILHPGDIVAVKIPSPIPMDLQPEALPLDILYEDVDILVINKAAGMVVHPGAGNPSGTMVNAILAHCPDLKGVGGVLRPGIVHRLDKQTSGVIIVAKDDAAIHYLQQQFKQRTVKKRYIALLNGRLVQSNGLIEAPIGRHRVHRQRMAVIGGGKNATTRWKVSTRYLDNRNHPYSLVDIDLLTGRTHQIRVHFSWLGYPVVGDRTYGPSECRLQAPRQFLHAASLTIKHPQSGEEMVFTAPLPEDLSHLLQQLHRDDGH